jgi:PST family polysaccharide transporter
MRLRERAVDAVVWTGIRNWGGQLGSFLVFVVLARLLPPEAFGLVAYASVLIAFTQVLVNQGFALAIVQRERLEPEHLDTAFWTGMVLSLAVLAVFAGLAAPIADLAGEPELEGLLPWLAAGVPLSALSAVHGALLQRELRFRPLALRTLVASAISGVAGIAMALSGFGVSSLVAQALVYAAVSVVVLWSAGDWRPGVRVSRTHFDDLFRFGINITGISLARFFAQRSDRLLIGYLLGPAELGIYTVAFRLIQSLADVVNGTLRQVAVPVFSKMQRNPEQVLRALYSATRTTSLISFPVFAGVAALSPELILVLFGSQWDASIPLMRVLAFYGIIHSVQYNSAVAIAMGRPRSALLLSLASALIVVIGIALAAPWGIVAVAAVIALRDYLVYPLSVAVLRPLIEIRFRELLGGYVAPALAAAVMAAVAMGLTWAIGAKLNVLLTLAISTVAAALTYVSLIRVGAPERYEATKELLVLALPGRTRPKQGVRAGFR